MLTFCNFTFSLLIHVYFLHKASEQKTEKERFVRETDVSFAR